jgi:excisionase family DNA binding protein
MRTQTTLVGDQSQANLAEDGLATIAEAGEFLRMCRSKVYELIEKRELASVKIGGSRRVPWASLRELVARHLANGE